MAPTKTQWLIYAIASGACAALNGVFAKLTTTKLTTTWAAALSHLFGFSAKSKFFEFLFRALFFGLNLLFNAIMWTLFTRALTLATSTVRVSIINTTANFLLTALLGLAVFSESLPGLWWLGAAFLVAGSVVIGARETAEKEGTAGTAGAEGGVLAGGLVGEGEGEDEDEDEGGDGEFRDEVDAPLEGVKKSMGRASGDEYRDSVELSPTHERRRS